MADVVAQLCATCTPEQALAALFDLVTDTLVEGPAPPGLPVTAVTLAADDPDGRLRAPGPESSGGCARRYATAWSATGSRTTRRSRPRRWSSAPPRARSSCAAPRATEGRSTWSAARCCSNSPCCRAAPPSRQHQGCDLVRSGLGELDPLK